MTLRISYIEKEPTRPSGMFGCVGWLLDKAKAHIVPRPETKLQHPPVSEDAMVLARFVLKNITAERLKFVQVTTPADYDPTTVYGGGDIQEYLRSERRDDSRGTRPIPHALLVLSGKGYGNYDSPSDAFYCQFGISYLEDGSRVIQAVPNEWESLHYDHEYAGMRAALAELFGGEEFASEAEGYARISLGFFDRNGKHTYIRPYNARAFGANLIELLDIASAPGLEMGLDVQVFPDNNKVVQLNYDSADPQSP